MKFIFTEKKLKMDDDLKAYAEKKIGKIDRFFKEESEAFVTFAYERGRYLAEVTIKNKGIFYRVSEATGDMFASIDSAVGSIERQIRKNKTRLEKKLREGAFEREIVPYSVTDEEEQEFNIVRRKTFSIKPMTAEEAILQMNLLEHEFYVFKDQDAGNYAVVYKRSDGGYGLIECVE